MTRAGAELLLQKHGPVALVQFWGDIDRPALASSGVPVWPLEPPASGQMAVRFPAIGPDALVRQRAGGLRAAELVARGGAQAATPDSVADVLRPTVFGFGGSA